MSRTHRIHRDSCGDRETGWTSRLGLPAYEVTEAAAMLGMKAETLSHWHRARGKAPALLAERPARGGLSYLDLIEAVVVKGLRDSGVPAGRIRKAYDHLRRVTGIDHPFARMRLERQGGHIFYKVYGRKTVTAEATQDGQTVIRDTIADLLRPLLKPGEAERRIRQLTFDTRLGITVRWYPKGKRYPVFVDPRFSFGAPVLEASRIPTGILLERYMRGGASPREIAEDFGISEREVRRALEFEGAEQRGDAA